MVQKTHAYPYKIDYSMHADARAKLVGELMKSPEPLPEGKNAVVVQGGDQLQKYDTDGEIDFRQESNFNYLFGVREPGFKGAIDLSTNKSMLFVPRLGVEWELWSGERKSLEYYQKHYQVDEVHYVDEMAEVLHNLGVKNLLRLYGLNRDSRNYTTTTCTFDGVKKFTVNDSIVHPALVLARSTKTAKELDLMRFVNKKSSEAHIDVMKTMRPGMSEYQVEATFNHSCHMNCGARFHAYTCICGSGNNGSVLHYGHAGAPNDKELEDGDMMLNDMGCEFHCYVSDITCTFPVNGKFTSDQKFIYESVLYSHDAALKMIKAGVSYPDVHVASHRALAEKLLEGGLLQNADLDTLMEHEISSYFYPHGLGHMMGLDVHDVGGYIGEMKKSTKKTSKYLRMGRKLETNMVVTVEPGCYFIPAQLKDLKEDPTKSQYVNWEMVDRFQGTGGVRIESDVIVTANGVENMTQVPRTVAEIEACMTNN